MRIPHFEVVNRRSIALAKCDAVPSLMVITGPNGAGKSTLLYELRNVGGRKNILYISPHRSARRQEFRQRDLYGINISYEGLLCQDQAPRYDKLNGVNLTGGQLRDPWSADESATYLKFSLCQIEIERQQAIAKHFDQSGQIAKDSIPDPWQPLRELTNSLLPHLKFLRIDNSDRANLRCLWSVHSRAKEVDIDDLSSGEKAIIQMFYPLLEHQIRGILAGIRGDAVEEHEGKVCVLIDEPELHLHPNLQMKVFDYLRILTRSYGTQVITVTHSSTIVEHANFQELYLLRPVELVPPGENQLIQIADDDDRLRLMREVFGTTSNVTAMQPIVIVEGIVQTSTSATLSDRKLYRALCRDFDAVTVIPGGGKSECLRLVCALNALIPSLSERLKAVALLDRDTGEKAPDAATHLLPVSMIENFLLDPLPLWEAIQSVKEKTTFATADDLASALDTALTDFEPEEIVRRAKAALGTYFFRPESPIDEIPMLADTAARAMLAKYSTQAVAAVKSQAEKRVRELTERKQRREHFHGKDVLDAFYQKHLHNSGLPKNVFKFEAARHARDRKAVKQFFELFFDALLEKKKTQHQEAAQAATR
jgi:hypothetical protein